MTGTEYRNIYSKSPNDACSALFECYCDYIYAIVYNKLRSTASRADIEECVSDIFADIFFGLNKSGEDYDGELKGYVGTVAKRRAINAYYSISARNGHQTDDADTEFETLTSGESVETETEDKEMRKVLLSRINELGEPDSLIILQKFYYDRSSAEIATMLSMKASAVRMRAARALKKLKMVLAADGIEI